MAKSSKLVAARKGRVLLVRRRRDRLWMFPGGRRRIGENERKCLRREIAEELPEVKVGPLKLWKEVKTKNRRSGRKPFENRFRPLALRDILRGATTCPKMGIKPEVVG